MKEKKVAILMATYNGALFLTEQLDSLINQTYQNFTCYIHDDGSDDGTVEILAEYSRKYSDKIVLIYGPKRGGAKNNFLYLISELKDSLFDYYMFCDQDDVWKSDKIEKMISRIYDEELNCEKSPILVYSDAYVTDSNLNIIHNSFEKIAGRNANKTKINNILVENTVAGCMSIFNYELFRLIVSPFNPQKIIIHDWLLAIIASSCGKLVFYDEPLIFYRQHIDNSVGVTSRKSKVRRINRIKKILSLHIFSEAHTLMFNCSVQAEEICKILKRSYNNENLKIMEEFGNYRNKSKIRRMKIIIKNQIYRNIRPYVLVICS